MNIDRVLQSLAKNEVDYLLIGGVNFLLRHAPEITYDIDVWIADNPKAAIAAETASGVPFWALSDQHMLEAQLALPVNQQKSQRIEALNKAIKNASDA